MRDRTRAVTGFLRSETYRGAHRDPEGRPAAAAGSRTRQVGDWARAARRRARPGAPSPAAVIALLGLLDLLK